MTAPTEAPTMAETTIDPMTAGMDDYVARALYYYQYAFDHNSNDIPSWEHATEAIRADLLLQARTAIEAFTDWRRAHGMWD